jgi:hypothetical protein
MTKTLTLTGTLTGTLSAITGLLAMTSMLAPAQAGQHYRSQGFAYGGAHIVHHIGYKKPLYFSYGHNNYKYSSYQSHKPRYYKTCAKWAYGHCLKWY